MLYREEPTATKGLAIPEGLLESSLLGFLGAPVSTHLVVGMPPGEGPREGSNGPVSYRDLAGVSLSGKSW